MLNKFKLRLIKFLLNGKEINLTGDNIEIQSNNFSVDKDGNMNCINANVEGSITSNNVNITGGKINIETNRSLGDQVFTLKDEFGAQSFVGPVNASIGYTGSDVTSGVYIQGSAAGQSMVAAQVITQTSLESQKKNIEKLKNGLDIVKSTDIYKYNFKTQKDEDKKHIGFIIGNKYKYSKDITAVDDKGNEVGVDNYSMISVAYKAIQEQQQIIESLQKQIEELKSK